MGILHGPNTGMGCHALLWDLPKPGIEPRSPELQVDGYFTIWATREAHRFCHSCDKWIKIWKMQNCHANKWISHKAELQRIPNLWESFYPPSLKKKKNYLFIWLHWVLLVAHGIFSRGMWDLVPWPGIEPRPSALGERSLRHWTTREIPLPSFLTLSIVRFAFWNDLSLYLLTCLLSHPSPHPLEWAHFVHCCISSAQNYASHSSRWSINV